MAPARPVDRRSALPLWAQVEDDLERRIRAGDFTDGFPTEVELQEEYDVSRHTVREALRRLRTSGTLESVRGRGTRVAGHDVEQSMGTLFSLFRSVEEQGMVQRSDVLALELVRDETAAADLEVDAAADLVLLERLRYADGEPLAHDRVYLPGDLAAPLLDADFARGALYDELEQRCGLRLSGGQERITAATGTPAVREILGAGDRPLLRIDRLARAGERCIETRVTHLRSDRFALTSRWDRTRR